MDWADLFANPPWPESSPNRREVKEMSFLETLSYDAPNLDDASNPYDAPDSYESTLTSILDTDFPLQSSPSRRAVLSPSRRGVLSPSRRTVLSPSRRGVLSRSSSGRSVFGDSRSVFGHSRSVFGDNTSVFNDSANVFDDSTNVFTDSANVFDDSRNLFGDSRNLFDDSKNLSGDSLENFSSGLQYAPSDRTGSVSDGDLRYAPSDLTSAASDRTGSVSDGEPYDALEARSLPCAPEAERAGEEGQGRADEEEQQSADEEERRANEEEQGSAGEEEQQSAGEEGQQQQSADEEEQANEGRSFTEIVSQFYPILPGLLLSEPSFAFVPHSPSFVPPSPSILPPSPSISRPYPSIVPPSPRIDAPSPSLLPPSPPSPRINVPSPTLLPPYPSVDVPARAQSPASALASLARFYGCFPDATDSAAGDQPYLAPCDRLYPAACDQSTGDEGAASRQDTVAQDSLAAGIEYDGGARDGGARDGGACDGGARNGDDAGGAQPISPRATSTVTITDNTQTKPRRKARKSKGKARASGDDAIEQPAPRATAPHAPAAAPASHSAAPASHSAARASHSASPASHSAARASHSAARASHSTARASHSAAHDDSPEYAEVIEQRRQAKRARKARGTNGRAVIDSAVNAAVAIAASVPDFASAPQPAARVQPVAARGQTVVNASAHAQAAPSVRARELVPTQSFNRSQVVTSSAPAPANGTGMTAAPMASRVPNVLPPSHLYPAALTPAAAPSAAAYIPQSALTSASMDATISSHSLAPTAHASSGSRTPAMLWQALMKGELTSEEMQAHLRPDVKKLPMLEGARADVLKSVTLSEGVPVAPPSFGSLSMGASSDSMSHPAGSSSSTLPTSRKRKHGHDAQPEDPNWTRCAWTHFDAKNKPMGPCTHFYNKKSDRGTLRESVREHMRKMEPNRCDGIFCQWAHDCKRNHQYFVDLYAVVDHIVDIILGTEMRVRR